MLGSGTSGQVDKCVEDVVSAWRDGVAMLDG
jgi:hypothetical protein